MLKSELGHAPVGILGIRLPKSKHAIALTKLNYLELGSLGLKFHCIIFTS